MKVLNEWKVLPKMVFIGLWAYNQVILTMFQLLTERLIFLTC